MNECLRLKSDNTASFTSDVTVNGDLTVGDRILGTKGANVASAENITLGDGNCFDITGTTGISRIENTGWTAGSRVVLRFNGTIILTIGAGASGNYKPLYISTGGTIEFHAYGWVELALFSTTEWQILGYYTA